MSVVDPSQPLHYYIYYRLRPEVETDDALATIRAMQAELAALTGVRGRLLQRYGESATWMEIYEDVADTAQFERALGDLAARHDCEGLLAPGDARHTERFTQCA